MEDRDRAFSKKTRRALEEVEARPPAGAGRPREGGGHSFKADTRLGRLFLGVAVTRPAWVPESSEGAGSIGPEDTEDADFGRLLEAAEARGLAGQPSLAQ